MGKTPEERCPSEFTHEEREHGGGVRGPPYHLEGNHEGTRGGQLVNEISPERIKTRTGETTADRVDTTDGGVEGE